MEWFGLAFLLLLGFAEGQNVGIDPQCDIIAEEVVRLKLPLIAQLKTFDSDEKFQDTWSDVFYKDCWFHPFTTCEWNEEYSYEEHYISVFGDRVRPFQIKEKMLNATLNVKEIIRSHDVKLKQYDERKGQILDRYYGRESFGPKTLLPFQIFHPFSVDNYDSLADASRCQPCTDADEFSSCLYKELKEIEDRLSIFREVAVSKRPVLLTETIDLLVNEFRNFPNITNEQIFDYYRNTVLKNMYNSQVEYAIVEWKYDWFLRNTIKNFAINFTQTVQTVLEPAYMKNTCVGNFLKDVITQIEPFVTPDASTAKPVLPKWNFDEIVASYVQPTTETDIDLIARFDGGFSRYDGELSPRYTYIRYNDNYAGIVDNNLRSAYSVLIKSIIYKGFRDLEECPDFGLVYGNSDFKDFVDNGNTFDEYVLNYKYDESDLDNL